MAQNQVHVEKSLFNWTLRSEDGAAACYSKDLRKPRSRWNHQCQDNTRPTSGSSLCGCKSSGHTLAAWKDWKDKTNLTPQHTIAVPLMFKESPEAKTISHQFFHNALHVIKWGALEASAERRLPAIGRQRTGLPELNQKICLLGHHLDFSKFNLSLHKLNSHHPSKASTASPDCSPDTWIGTKSRSQRHCVQRIHGRSVLRSLAFPMFPTRYQVVIQAWMQVNPGWNSRL